MRDRDLVRLYWPVELRPAFDALFGLEEVLFDVVTTSSEPALGAIRLAWWREALERLDHAPAPAEPRLQAIAAELLPRGVSGKSVAAMENGIATLLEERPEIERLREAGSDLFVSAARLLEHTDERLGAAGGLYFSVRAARLGLVEPETRDMEAIRDHRFPRRLRPLTGLAKLALRDVRQWPNREAEATPARAVALLSHRMFGTIA